MKTLVLQRDDEEFDKKKFYIKLNSFISNFAQNVKTIEFVDVRIAEATQGKKTPAGSACRSFSD